MLNVTGNKVTFTNKSIYKLGKQAGLGYISGDVTNYQNTTGLK